MICLDANYLILGLHAGSQESEELLAWSQAGETLITPMACWFELLCGPVTPVQVNTMKAFLDQIVPFDAPQAAAAAMLFKAVGRKRNLRMDATIAATALSTGALLATNNRSDFVNFIPHGLKLTQPSEKWAVQGGYHREFGDS